MTNLQFLREIREHFVKYHHLARDWGFSPVVLDDDGTPVSCLILKGSEICQAQGLRNGLNSSPFSRAFYGAMKIDLLEKLQEGKANEVLCDLERAIAKLEEHEVIDGKRDSEPTYSDSTCGSRSVLESAGTEGNRNSDHDRAGISPASGVPSYS